MFGGMYSDLDNIFVENNGLAQYKNMACREVGNIINNSVMYFEKGHAFIQSVIEQFFTVTMEELGWAYSGPKLLSRY